MARNAPGVLKGNPRCRRDREINILLLGQTGVGKSTFINAFANYIVNDTLKEAVNDEMQVIIPSSFSHTDAETFNERMIVIGRENDYEKFSDVTQSNTQQCRSFVFPIGDRNLRFIDTPGIGDTRGIRKDEENFQEILNFIAQYEHLNGVFILLKPNEERLNVLFRFSVNELLRHLHVDAKTNIIFVFTNARSTLFTLGSTKVVLGGLLDKHRREHNVDIPFTKDNTYLFDNEPFRYLALQKNGICLDEDQTQSYTKSWDYSVKEYSRLMQHINTLTLHAISSTISLNEAEQLIRKLPRPLAETARLIEENIQLAKDYKKRVLENPELASEGIPQANLQVAPLRYPRTVCCGDKCCRTNEVNGEIKIEYLKICHDECYLKGVVQETLCDPKLEECTSMHPYTGDCRECGCHWLQHKHITYECNTQRTHIRFNTRRASRSNERMSLNDIDKRISDLREEEKQIKDVYKKLVKFLHENSLLTVNNDFIDYLQYFIREEEMKRNEGAQNAEIIANLERMITDFKNDMELFTKVVQEQAHSANSSEKLQPEDIFNLVGTLYELPINGEQIQQQVDGIKIGQLKYGAKREIYVELPAKAARSKVMHELEKIMCKAQTKT